MDIKLPSSVLDVFKKFKDANFQIYLVGGSVRDLLLKRETHDWDFTTDAKPEEIMKLFPSGFNDNKFGTVGVPINDEIFEITTMRKEGDYRDFRHPIEVSWTKVIKEDLARRDFTINAMALGINLQIVDPFNGQEDLKNGIIKAVGDPNLRFKEDALRLMRAIRIATQLGFEIEKKTFECIKADKDLIKEVAHERIRDELLKLLSSNDPYAGMVKLRECGLLEIILPELEACFGIQQEGPKHDRVYDIGEHSFLSLKFAPTTDPIVRFATLLHDTGKVKTVATTPDGNVTFYNHDLVGGKIVRDITKRFNFSKKDSEKIYTLVRWHMFTIDENQTDSAIRRFIKNVGVENIDDMFVLRVGDRLGGGTAKAVSWRMEKYRERITQVLKKPFSITDLKVNGKDVMDTLNIKPSRKVGEILQKLFEEVLEDSNKNARDYLLKRITDLVS